MTYFLGGEVHHIWFIKLEILLGTFSREEVLKAICYVSGRASF